MSLLQTLKFVHSAVAKKDLIPSLTHFRIKNKTVLGFNGQLAISSPIDLELDVTPNADQFRNAIETCDKGQQITMRVAPNGKLSVKSGNFHAFVDCLSNNEYHEVIPEGLFVPIASPLLPALETLEPFIANDEKNQWACGILFDSDSAYATNNKIFVQHWLGWDFPKRINIPAATVRQLIRIGENPAYVQVTDTRITFHFSGKRWLSSQLFAAKWPDMKSILATVGTDCHRLAEGFFDGIEKLIPFTDQINAVYFQNDKITTAVDSGKSGASVAIKCASKGKYNAIQLLKLRGIALAANFESYPKSIPFIGKTCRGIMLGLIE